MVIRKKKSKKEYRRHLRRFFMAAKRSGAGATIVGGEGVICQEAPDADAIEQCKALGKALANA